MSTPAGLPPDVEAERWAPIAGHAFYEVSSLGRVRSVKRSYVDAMGRTQNRRQHVLTPTPGKHGHMRVQLGRRVDRYVHQLVLEAFVGPCPLGMEGCHENGDPTNNTLANLRWDTHHANMRDVRAHGTHRNRKKTHCPRGHLLKPPNIVRHALAGGTRECLACSRGQSRAKYLTSRGAVADRVAISHAYYAEIMKEAAA